MKITKGKIAVFGFVLLLILLAAATVFTAPREAFAQASETFEMFLCRSVEIDQSEGGWLAVTCYKDETSPYPGPETPAPTTPVVTAPPTPTEPPTETPTQTSTPEPTDTPEPTGTGIPGEPYPEAPLCAEHDPLAFHELWNAEFGCHYDHHHGDDPHEVDDVFGTEYLEVTGGDIQMFWQPAGTDPVDTARKHQGLFWMVRRNVPCQSTFGNGCVTDFRAEIHTLTDVHDNVRFDADGNPVGTFHVTRVEARVCPLATTDVCGIVRLGGRQYLGDVTVDGNVVFDVPEPRDMFGQSTPRPVSVNYWNIGQRSFSNWYMVHPNGLLRIVPEIGDVWAPINPDDPMNNPLVGGRNNQSYIQPHVISVVILRHHLPTLDPDGDGMADFQGYVDVNGFFQSDCTAPGPGCIPVSYEGVPVSTDRALPMNYQFRGDHREYDVLFDRQTSGWIKHPGMP